VQEVPRPDVVPVLRRPPHAAVGAGPQPPLFPLLAGHPQPLLPPEPVHALAVDPPTLAPQQGPDPPVAVARALTHQFQHPRHQPCPPLPGLFGLPLRRARLPQHPTGAALGDAEPLLEATHRLPALVGRHHFFCTTSWSICLSRASSATRRLRRAFSASNSPSLLASSALRPPYLVRPRWRVGSLTPCSSPTWAMVRPLARASSPSRRFA